MIFCMRAEAMDFMSESLLEMPLKDLSRDAILPLCVT